MTTSPPPTRPTFVVSAVCLRDERGRILTVRKRGTEVFMLPGGKIEAGETPAQTAIREIAEEVDLELATVVPLGRFVADAANEPGHLVDSEVFTADYVGEPVAAGEIDELRWLDPVDLEAFDAPLAPLLRDHVLPALSPITVVGIGAEGWVGLTETVRDRISAAPIVLGAQRTLDLLPAVEGQVRETWPSPFSVEAIDSFPARPVLVLASGDPLVSGVATTLLRRFGAARVEVVLAVSSVALARARMRWSAEETVVVTVVGRRHEAVLRELAPGRRILVLSSDATSPAVIAALLTGAGYGETRMSVLANLGASDEAQFEGFAATWDADVPALNIVALDCRGPVIGSWSGGLPDDAFEHDGQLTKRDLRASALARLAPQPDQLLWDVGAGAGSIGIEWMRAHPTSRTVAIELDADRAARVARNAATLGVPELDVVVGAAPDALTDLPDPDAIFVGGGASAPGLLALCRERLRPGGRLVVHGVTLETSALLVEAFGAYGGELSRHAVEHAEPLGAYTGWRPARPVVQWCWRKP